MNTYIPTRIMVPLNPRLSRALGRETERRKADDPRLVAAELLNERLTQIEKPTTQYITDPLACPNCGGDASTNGRCDVCGAEASE